MDITKKSLEPAIAEAMFEFLAADREFRPHDPAIMADRQRIYYGSKLTADHVLLDLREGFGAWEPESAADIPGCASGLADEVIASL